MKNESTTCLQRPSRLSTFSFPTIPACLQRLSAARLLSPLTRYYSHILGYRLTLRQTLSLINAQAAFFFAVFPVDSPLPVRFGCLGWMVYALLKCRSCGVKLPR